MPLTSRSGESSGGWEQGTSDSGSMQVLVQDLPTALPLSIIASGLWNSGLLIGDGYPRIMAAVLMDHAGSLVVHRFVDMAGTMERTAITTSIVASTLLIVDVTDLLPFLTYSIDITNAVGAPGNITKFSLLLSN